jgi:hypothetical protein
LRSIRRKSSLLSTSDLNGQKAQQGARANDHGCYDRCSEQHGSRQPRSWLILNVSQMKTTHLPSVAVTTLLVLCAAAARGDSAKYAEILAERERILSQIVADQESKRAAGKVDDEALFSAQIALHAFRRDSAKAIRQKVVHQELIVNVCLKRLEAIKARVQAGAGDQLEVLRARDSVLAAIQLVEELLANVPKG